MFQAKVIRPKKRYTMRQRDNLRVAMRRIGRGVKKDYESLTNSWENKPEFAIRTHVAKGSELAMIEVYPRPGTRASAIYTFVNRGTKPHNIWAGYYTGKSKKKTLVFPSGFTPKTAPGRLTSGSGGSSLPMVFTPFVRHPGTKAREFDKAMSQRWRKRFLRAMEGAMRKSLRESGYAV